MPDTLASSVQSQDTLYYLHHSIPWYDVIPTSKWHHEFRPFIAVYPNAPAVWHHTKYLSQKFNAVSLDEDTMPHERRYALEALSSRKAKGLVTTANMLMHPDVEKMFSSIQPASVIINHSEQFIPFAFGPYDKSRYSKLAQYLATPYFEQTPFFFITGINSTNETNHLLQSLNTIRTTITSETQQIPRCLVHPQIKPCLTGHQKLTEFQRVIQPHPDKLHIVVCRDGFEQKAVQKYMPTAFILQESLLTNRQYSLPSLQQQTAIVLCTPSLLPLLLHCAPHTGYTVTFWEPLWSIEQQTALLGYLTQESLHQLPTSFIILYCPDDFNTMTFAWQRKGDESMQKNGVYKIKQLKRILYEQAKNSSMPLPWLKKLVLKFT